MADAKPADAKPLDAKSTADEKCTPGCVDDEGSDAVTRGERLVPINAVALGIGVVALAASGYLLLTSSAGAKKRAAASRLGQIVFFGARAGGALGGSF